MRQACSWLARIYAGKGSIDTHQIQQVEPHTSVEAPLRLIVAMALPREDCVLGDAVMEPS